MATLLRDILPSIDLSQVFRCGDSLLQVLIEKQQQQRRAAGGRVPETLPDKL